MLPRIYCRVRECITLNSFGTHFSALNLSRNMMYLNIVSASLLNKQLRAYKHNKFYFDGYNLNVFAGIVLERLVYLCDMILTQSDSTKASKMLNLHISETLIIITVKSAY